SRSDTTTRSVARRVRPQAESILHDPPIQRKAPFGAFFASAAPQPESLLSRFNSAPIGIRVFPGRYASSPGHYPLCSARLIPVFLIY
ncbi:hypothetical protein PTR08_18865, partial [Serratia ureilytica]|uniref:hypothetical protein n=2 Tax=Serratia ureilytica TaxID=300181 RepID=UPI00313B2DC4